MHRRYPLHVHISTLLLLVTLILGGLVGGIGFKLSRDMLEATAADLTQRISREILGEARSLIAPAELAVDLLRHDPVGEATTLAQRRQRLAAIDEVLGRSGHFASFYVGYANGDFFFVRPLADEATRQALGAPPGTRYLVQDIERGGTLPRGRYLYLGPKLEPLGDEDHPEYPRQFDPRSRPWYRSAVATSERITTDPYRFFSSGNAGVTIARRSPSGRAVVGADILLATLSASLGRQKVTPGSRLAVVNGQGQVIAGDDPAWLATATDGGGASRPRLPHLADLGSPALASLAAPLARLSGTASHNARLQLADGDWRVDLHPLQIDGGAPLYLAMAVPERELLAAALAIRATAVIATVVILLLSTPLTWWIARVVSRPMQALALEAETIRRFEFEQPIAVRSMIREVDELAQTMDGMKRTIHRFLELTRAVAAEDDFARLLPMLLRETLVTADARAGVLYLADDGGLTPAAALAADGVEPEALPATVSVDRAPGLMAAAIADQTPRTGRLTAADRAALGLGGVLAAGPDDECIVVPLINRRHHLAGVMLLVRAGAIDPAQLSFVKALSGSATSSLEARELISAQKQLFEAFVRLIAGAIDAKSPYTGGHCARVPELTKMLAAAACAATSGPFRDFQLDADQWEALHVAAWLHDCGKVTTPEYVVDKATKLETLYDRIHEVRMRFEVLKRDAEIACLRDIAAGADPGPARAQLAAAWRSLDDDFAFVAACNEGGEFMAPEQIARLQTIAARRWQRTLDDRLGLAREERERKGPPAPLPVSEPLLADKPEHRIERSGQGAAASDNPWGFRLQPPPLLYNRGELHNLSVARGTLSEEDRYKINEHIVQTIIMLSQLPFPKHLRQVPEIAGGHHEKMDGSGYPRQLLREQMSPLARMMAIADIFEALTAVDRPYKAGKTLSEAIRIMARMKDDHHIDPDLFDLFLRSGVYRQYAERFLGAGQIDAVDVSPYLATPP